MSGSLLVMAVSMFIWGIALSGQSNALVSTSDGLVSFRGDSWWLAAAVPLALLALASSAGAIRAWQGWSVTASLATLRANGVSSGSYNETLADLGSEGEQLEGLTIGLLLMGGFIVVIGWVVGVVFLWSSPVWRLRDKLLGTFMFPGGLALPFILTIFVHGTRSSVCVGTGTVEHCVTTTSGVLPLWAGISLEIVLIGVPILVALHLNRTRRRSRQFALTPPSAHPDEDTRRTKV